MATRDLTKMALFVTLLCVSAYISFPIPFSPAMVTALTLVFVLIALVLSPKQTLIVSLVWFALGAAGLPVFSGGVGGLGKVFGPAGGFYFSFMVAYPLVSMLKGSERSFLRYTLVSILVSLPVTYAFGVTWMMVVLGISFQKALMLGAVPFIPGDIIKCIVGAWLATKIKF